MDLATETYEFPGNAGVSPATNTPNLPKARSGRRRPGLNEIAAAPALSFTLDPGLALLWWLNKLMIILAGIFRHRYCFHWAVRTFYGYAPRYGYVRGPPSRSRPDLDLVVRTTLPSS